MAVRLILKNSVVEDKRPNSTQLDKGEVSLNSHEAGPFLCVEDSAGVIQQVAGVKISVNAPADPLRGTMWIDSSDNKLYCHDGSTWLLIAGAGGGGGGGGGTLTAVLGGQGIDTSTAGSVVTVNADPNENKGIEISNGKIAAKLGTGLQFNSGTGAIESTGGNALAYKGTCDVTSSTVPAAVQGDVYANTGDGNCSAEWLTALDETGPVDGDPGDLLIFNGTKWSLVPTGGGGGGGITNLSYVARDGSTANNAGTVESSTGTDANIPAAGSGGNAGLMIPGDKVKLDAIEAGAQVNVNPSQTYTAAADEGTLTLSPGSDTTTIPAATTSDAGLFTGTDKTKLDGIDPGAQANVGTNLSNTPDVSTVDVDSSTGTGTTLPAATTSAAGVMTSADKTKLDGIDPGASATTNLGIDTRTATTLDVTSSTGTSATVPEASTTEAGLQTAADKTKLDGIATGAEVNVNPTQAYTAAASTGTLTLSPGGDTTTLPAATTTEAGLVPASAMPFMPTGGDVSGSPEKCFYNNEQTIDANYTVTATTNSGSFGPITIDAAATVTVASGGTWTVVGGAGQQIDTAGFWSRSGTTLSLVNNGDTVNVGKFIGSTTGLAGYSFQYDVDGLARFAFGEQSIGGNDVGYMRYQHLTGGGSTNYTDVFQSNNDLKISTAGSVGVGTGATSTITLGADGQVKCSLQNGDTGFPINVQVNGSNTFFVTSAGVVNATDTAITQIGSERRIKENIVAVDPAVSWETIKSTPYYSYNFIGSEHTTYGPMADEVPAEMVIQPMEENEFGVMVARSDDQGPIRSYNNGMLQARLYTALQTALTRIEALEAQLTALQEAQS